MYARPIRRLLLRGRRTFIAVPAQPSLNLASRRVLLPAPNSLLSARAGFHTTPASWGKSVQKFNLADIGEGITECEIIKWSVSEGSRVQAFDPLCEVQSDKASVEITSPFDGVVTKLIVPEGSIAKVGEGLCLIETEEEGVSQPSVPEPGSQAASAPPLPAPEAEPVNAAVKAPVEQQRRLHPMDPNYVSPAPSASAGSTAAPLGSGVSSKDVLAAPSVRHFARQKSVDLGLLMPGSGKGGRVEKADVERYLAGGASAPAKDIQSVVQEQDAVVELGRTRYGMWKAMTKSLEIPHFGYTTTLDLTALHNLLPILNANIPTHYLPGTPKSPYLAVDPSALYPAPTQAQVAESQQYARLTFLPILLKTLSKAMVQWPLFRASLTSTPTPSSSEKPSLTIRPRADISVALSTPTGLYTPTLTSVDAQSIYTLASSLNHLAFLGRQTPSGLTPKEMPKRGGTITVSNVGAIGKGDSAMPLLVPGGGVAIVALGRAKWVWDVDGEFYDEEGKGGGRGRGAGMMRGERRLKMGVSWSGDHRVVEGAELAAFVECWRGYVERPERLIGEGV